MSKDIAVQVSMDDDLRISERLKETDYGNGWTESVQDKFEEILKSCKKKVILHNEASSYFVKWYNWTTYPSIFLSTVLTVLTTYNSSIQDEEIGLTIAGISGLSTLFYSLSSFWEYGKRSEKHVQASLQYASLVRSLTAELFLPVEDRNSTHYCFDIYSMQLSTIEASEPSIPKFIFNMFSK